MIRVPVKTIISALILAAAVAAPPVILRAAAAPAMPPSEAWSYNIRFLFFTQAAQGHLKITRLGGNRYRAELLAETKGLVGILMYGRKNHYISEMTFDPVKRRFVSRLYTKRVHKQGGVERTTAVIDSKSGVVRWKYFWNDKLVGEGNDPMPGGKRVEDLLSAFFNLLLGSLGPLEHGRKMTVFTLPNYKAKATKEITDEDELKFQKFEIRIPSAESERAYRKIHGRTKEKGLLALVKVPKSLFGQETGEVRVWLDAKRVPVAATVEDAIFFGDVEGVLIRPGAER